MVENAGRPLGTERSESALRRPPGLSRIGKSRGSCCDMIPPNPGAVYLSRAAGAKRLCWSEYGVRLPIVAQGAA